MSFFAADLGFGVSKSVFYCAIASIIDGISIVSIYLLAMRILGVFSWKFYLLAGGLGALFAIAFEKIALFLGLWSYGESMTVIPVLEIGILPFIQLTLLTPLSIYLAIRFYSNEQ